MNLTPLPFLAAIACTLAALFTASDPMAVHDNERPPNTLRLEGQTFNVGPAIDGSFNLRILQPAPFPEERAEYVPSPEPTATPSPTPVPVPEPVAVAAAGVPLTSAEMRALLVEVGAPAEWLDDLVAIGWCEASGGYWKWNRNGEDSRGLWQLWAGWFPAAGFSADQWMDPRVNAATAVYVRSARGQYGGGGGWSCADKLGIP